MLRTLLLLLLSLVSSAAAGEGDVNTQTAEEMLTSTLDKFQVMRASDQNSADDDWLLRNLTGESKEEYVLFLLELRKARDTAKSERMAAFSTFNQNVFEWQRFSTKIIFWMVILLVALGVFFSTVQFYKSYQIVSRSETELSISDKGFTIRTSVLGLVILGLSLIFCYLYIAFVYPITVHALY